MKKLFSLIAMLLVALSVITTGFGQTPNADAVKLEITEVQIEGVDFEVDDLNDTKQQIVSIERGESLNVRVELKSIGGADDVKVKAWIGGYEYDDIEDSTSLFDMNDGTTYIKNLVLEIPNDLELDDSKYTLHIEAYNDAVNDELDFGVDVQAKRHLLNFVDVIFNPGLSVKNTQPLFVTVRVENLGENKQDDVRVEVAIPELGISQRTFIDELVTKEDDNNDDDEETSASSDTLLLDLSNVQAGVYALRVKVDYNRGHDFIVQNYQLTVTSDRGAGVPTQDLIVQAITDSMSLSPGGSATYTFSLANLGSDARSFTFEVTGHETWATARVEPLATTVLPDSTKDVKVTVNAKADADAGSKVFTVKVREGDQVVKELQFEADVKQPVTVDNTKSLRSGLEVGFIVLLVILVILGIILAINKLKGGKEESGESYY